MGRSGEQGSEDGGRHGGDGRRMGRVERDGLGSHSRERREGWRKVGCFLCAWTDAVKCGCCEVAEKARVTEEMEEHEREVIGSRPDLDRHKLPCVLVHALIHLDEGVGEIFQKVVAGVTKPTVCCNSSTPASPHGRAGSAAGRHPKEPENV